MPRLFSLVALVLLTGCMSRGPVPGVQDFSLTIGQQVALSDGSTLRYAGIANDSRCPPDVQCIRAGDADVLFDHALQGTRHRITLNTERTRSAAAGVWRLHLVDLAAGDTPRVTVRIQPIGTTP